MKNNTYPIPNLIKISAATQKKGGEGKYVELILIRLTWLIPYFQKKSVHQHQMHNESLNYFKLNPK